MKYGSVSGYSKGIFSSPKSSRPAPGAHLAFFSVDESLSETKQPGHESDLSPPCNVKIKNEWSDKSIPSFVVKGIFTGWTVNEIFK